MRQLVFLNGRQCLAISQRLSFLVFMKSLRLSFDRVERLEWRALEKAIGRWMLLAEGAVILPQRCQSFLLRLLEGFRWGLLKSVGMVCCIWKLVGWRLFFMLRRVWRKGIVCQLVKLGQLLLLLLFFLLSTLTGLLQRTFEVHEARVRVFISVVKLFDRVKRICYFCHFASL